MWLPCVMIEIVWASPAITITEPDPLQLRLLQQQTLHVALLP
jgi:hypothetical protein